MLSRSDEGAVSSRISERLSRNAGSLRSLACRRRECGSFTEISCSVRRSTIWRARSGSVDHPSKKRSEEHTSELQSLMRISYAVFCLKKKNKKTYNDTTTRQTTICKTRIQK